MRIAHLQIESFRSLFDTTIAPRDLSVLVGPNNAGKTNIADAINFFGEVMRHGLETAVGRHGGYENIAYRRKRRTQRPVRFKILAYLDASEISYGPAGAEVGTPVALQYSFEIRASSASRVSDFAVRSEQLRVSLIDRPPDDEQLRLPVAVAAESLLYRLTREDMRLSMEISRHGREDPSLSYLLSPLTDPEFERYLADRIEPTSLILSQLTFSYLIRHTVDTLARMRLYQLTPIECRKAGSPTPNPELERNGGNLPALVQYMQRRQPDAWQDTMTAMRSIVPGLEGIEPDFTPERRLTLKFVESGAGRGWFPAEVSDGTIQSLALFASLFDRRAPLAVIEEPENSVHPWIVRSFVDACRSVEGKQIIVTTHSPALIGYLKPEEVSVVWREEGRTHLRSLEELDPSAREIWEEGEADLFEIIDGGWLRQSVPQGFS